MTDHTFIEAALITRAVSGDGRALEQLLQLHRVALLQYITRHLPKELSRLIEPLDVAQDTYFQAFLHIASFVPSGDNPVYRWLITIARTRMIDLVRRQKAHKRGGGATPTEIPFDASGESLVMLLESLAVHHRTPSRSAALHELHLAIEHGVENLPQNYRDAIRLRHIDGMAAKEAAAHLNCSEGAFHMLCSRGLKALRIAMRSASLYI